MSDHDSRWRNDQGYRRDDERREGRWGGRWGGEDQRMSRDEGREDYGRYGRDSMSGGGGRQPGYGYEGHGRGGYDYGRDYWRQEEGRGGFGQSAGGRDYESRDYGGRDRGSYGQDYGSRGYGGRDYGANYDSRGDYGQDFGQDLGGSYGSRGRGMGGYGRSDYRGDQDRGFFERAGDEMASWFGDDDAERRRRMDAQRGDSGAQHHRGRGPRGYSRSDERVREDVSDRLTEDPYIDASEIDVTVSNGEVTLSGTVDGRRTKRWAEDLVESISGVRHVQNNLRVRQQAHGGGTAAGANAMAGLGSTGTGSGSTSGTAGTTGTTGTTTASTTRTGTSR